MTYGRCKSIDTFTALAVRGDGCPALGFEIIRPFGCRFRICKIHAVQNYNPGLVSTNAINIRIATGNGDPGVHDLTYSIHLLQVLLHLAAGLGHVTGIPLDIHLLFIHYPITPMREKSISSCPRLLPGKSRKMALPSICRLSICPIS